MAVSQLSEAVADSPGGLGTGCAAVLLAVGFWSRLRHGYEWDELQLLHGAWSTAHGLLPYRDFFEHHPPLMLFLLAPFIGGRTAASPGLLVALRLTALAVLVGILHSLVRLARPTTGAVAAGWSAVALLVLCPLSGKLFELRADWVGLLCVLAALRLLVPGTRASARWPLTLLAGILAGTAMCLTQKAVFPWLTILGWFLALVVIGTEGRSGVVRDGLAFLAGTLVPLGLLALIFARHHALTALLWNAIGINLEWPREVRWQLCWYETSRAACGLMALATAYAARRVREGVAGRGDRAQVALLLGGLAITGTAAYLVTPVPWEQSFLFLVVPWMSYLTIAAVAAYVTTPAALWRDRFLVGAALLVGLVPLPWRLAIHTLAIAAVLATLIALVVRLTLPQPARVQAALLVVLLPGLLLFGRDRLSDVLDERGRAQARFARDVARRITPDEAVFAMWDNVLPFHPAPTYHWFAHEGVLRRFAASGDHAAAVLDDEYARAVERGAAQVVIIDTALVDAYLPRFGELVRRRCERIVPGYAGSNAYRCHPVIPHHS